MKVNTKSKGKKTLVIIIAIVLYVFICEKFGTIPNNPKPKLFMIHANSELEN